MRGGCGSWGGSKTGVVVGEDEGRREQWMGEVLMLLELAAAGGRPGVYVIAG